MIRARACLALLACSMGCGGPRLVAVPATRDGSPDATFDVVDGAASVDADEDAPDDAPKDAIEAPLPVDAQPVVPLPREVNPLPYDAEGLVKTVGTCDEALHATPMAPTSAQQNLWLLVGRWRHCDGVDVARDGAPGIELARSRRWYSISTAATGGVERSGGDGFWWTGAEDTVGTTTDPGRLLELFRALRHDRWSFEVFENPTTLRFAEGSSTYVWRGE
jgi:hypothetical protein